MGERFIPEALVNPESKEKKELRATTMRGILRWMERLEKSWQTNKKTENKLSPSLRLGAFFIPAAVIGLSTGCENGLMKAVHENGWEIAECSEDEDAYIDAAFDWLTEHPQEIQTQMNELWPNTNLDAFQMIASLKAANIECGYQKSDDETVAVAFRDFNTIIIDVNQTGFINDLEIYKETSWIENYEIDDLVNEAIETQNLDKMEDVNTYYFFLSGATRNLLHETGHLAYDLSHTEDQRHDGTLRDAIDAWGEAAQEATIKFGEDPYQEAWTTINS